MLDASADACLAWAAAGGLQMHSSLAVTTSGALRGRALMATADIPRGTELLRVPYSLLLTANDVPPAFDDLGQTNRLAVALLTERRQPSRWALPLSMLPETFDTPLYYTPDQLAWLQGSPLVAWASSRALGIERGFRSVQSRWATTVAAVGSGGAVEDAGARLEELRWALSVAWSRSFMVQLRPGAAKTASLVPVGDLINHAENHLANTASQRSVALTCTLPPAHPRRSLARSLAHTCSALVAATLSAPRLSSTPTGLSRRGTSSA